MSQRVRARREGEDLASQLPQSDLPLLPSSSHLVDSSTCRAQQEVSEAEQHTNTHCHSSGSTDAQNQNGTHLLVDARPKNLASLLTMTDLALEKTMGFYFVNLHALESQLPWDRHTP